jgi:hypothetical protein
VRSFSEFTFLVSFYHPDTVQSPPESENEDSEEDDDQDDDDMLNNDQDEQEVVEEPEEDPPISKKRKRRIGESFFDAIHLTKLTLICPFTTDEEAEEGLWFVFNLEGSLSNIPR